MTRPSIWSFIAGLLWGMSSGIGLMVWVVVKLLKFQSRELERRHAWLRWVAKYRDLPQPAEGQPVPMSDWEDLDEEFRLLLRAVDGELRKRELKPMDKEELQVAIRTLLEYRDEGNPSFAITAAVHNVRTSRLRQVQQEEMVASRGWGLM